MFYITNDRTMTAEEVVFSANDRCDQENLIAQLKSNVKDMQRKCGSAHRVRVRTKRRTQIRLIASSFPGDNPNWDVAAA